MSDQTNTTQEPFDPKKTSPVLWKDRKHHLWFPLSFTKYRIQDDRLYKDVGLFTTVSDEVMLYRIIDLTLVRTFAQKIFGTGTVLVTCRMNREEVIKLENIANPKKVKDYISRLVEQERTKRNVVGKEFFGADIHHHDAMDMASMDMADIHGPMGGPMDDMMGGPMADPDGTGFADVDHFQ